MFGLDVEQFCSIHSPIIDEEPLPDLNTMYSRVIREEQHLHTSRSKEIKSDAIGFSAQTEQNNVPMPIVAAAVTPSHSRDPQRFCTHYNRKGHDNTECFLIHGYPDWWYEQQQRSGISSNPSYAGNNLCGRGGARFGSQGSLGRGRSIPPRNTSSNFAAANATTNPTSHQVTILISLLQNQQTQLSTECLSEPFYEDHDWSR